MLESLRWEIRTTRHALRCARSAARILAAGTRVRRLLERGYDDHAWQPRDWHGRFAATASGGTLSTPLAGEPTSDTSDPPKPKDGIQVAGPPFFTPVALELEEVAGGQTIARHVGKSDEELIFRAFMAMEENGGKQQKGGYSASTFEDLHDANVLVNLTLARNAPMVFAVSSGLIRYEFLDLDYPGIVGREVNIADRNSTPVLRTPTRVRVLIMHDEASPKGFVVHSAYPMTAK